MSGTGCLPDTGWNSGHIRRKCYTQATIEREELNIELVGKKLSQGDSFVYLGGAVCVDMERRREGYVTKYTPKRTRGEQLRGWWLRTILQNNSILSFILDNIIINCVRVLGRCYLAGLNVYITSLYRDLNVAPNCNWKPNIILTQS